MAEEGLPDESCLHYAATVGVCPASAVGRRLDCAHASQLCAAVVWLLLLLLPRGDKLCLLPWGHFWRPGGKFLLSPWGRTSGTGTVRPLIRSRCAAGQYAQHCAGG